MFRNVVFYEFLNASHDCGGRLGALDVTTGQKLIGTLSGAERGIGTVSANEVRSAGPRRPYADLWDSHESTISIVAKIAYICKANRTANSNFRLSGVG